MLSKGILPVLIDGFSMRYGFTIYINIINYMIDYGVPEYTLYAVVGIYVLALTLAAYIMIHVLGQYFSLLGLLAFYIYSSFCGIDGYTGGIGYCFIIIHVTRMITSRSTGKIAEPFTNWIPMPTEKKAQIDPMSLVVLTLLGFLMYISNGRTEYMQHAIAVVLMLFMVYMFYTSMPVGQNAFGIIPIVLIIGLAFLLLPFGHALLEKLASSTTFQPVVEVNAMDGLWNSLGNWVSAASWSGTAGLKFGLIRILLVYILMTMFTVDEIRGPKSATEAVLTTMAMRVGMIRNYAGNFNSPWIYTTVVEAMWLLITGTPARAAVGAAGICIGVMLQGLLLAPTWAGRGYQSTFNSLKAGMTVVLGDGPQGARLALVRWSGVLIAATYFMQGWFSYGSVTLVILFILGAKPGYICALLGFSSGVYSLCILGFVVEDPISSTSLKNSVPAQDGVGGNSGPGLCLTKREETVKKTDTEIAQRAPMTKEGTPRKTIHDKKGNATVLQKGSCLDVTGVPEYLYEKTTKTILIQIEHPCDRAQYRERRNNHVLFSWDYTKHEPPEGKFYKYLGKLYHD